MNLPPDIEHMIDTAAQAWGVPLELARGVAWVESRGDQRATSRVGAIGVMQLMPETAAALNVDPYDAAENIRGGVRYLGQLFRHYGTEAGLAAYNWGAGHLEHHGVENRPYIATVEEYIRDVLARAQLEAQRIAGEDTQPNPIKAAPAPAPAPQSGTVRALSSLQSSQAPQSPQSSDSLECETQDEGGDDEP